jgi:hypothetical protein
MEIDYIIFVILEAVCQLKTILQKCKEDKKINLDNLYKLTLL